MTPATPIARFLADPPADLLAELDVQADLADPRLTEADERLARIVQHPDGWYWLADDSHQQFGPFDCIEAVLADMDAPDDAPGVDSTLAEAEQALGLADWVDPDTGLLAEDTPTHLEDH